MESSHLPAVPCSLRKLNMQLPLAANELKLAQSVEDQRANLALCKGK